jgi:alkanesulfonate monooxygenase SsuD/methylene tetrahydromethanopterin reductase-like flavin-dependent oxidoreductase (luciferase family)
MTNRGVAAAMGWSESLVRQWRDPDNARTIPDGERRRLLRRYRRLARRYWRMEREDHDGGVPLPGLDEDTHKLKIAKAFAKLMPSEGRALASAVRDLIGAGEELLLDLTGEDE